MTPALARLIESMTEYDRGDAPRIQHFMKVHDFATTIGILEGIDEKTLRILEAAAVLHDIGIHLSEERYGNDNGKHQEELGPDEARRLLEQNGNYDAEEIERICFLIGHHHTYTGIDGLDWQILLEADFLVNSFESCLPREAIDSFRRKVFRTPSGIRLLNLMWDINTVGGD